MGRETLLMRDGSERTHGPAAAAALGILLNVVAAAVGLTLLLVRERAGAGPAVPVFVVYGILWIACLALGVTRAVERPRGPLKAALLLAVVPGVGHVAGALGHAGELALALRRGASTPDPPA